MKHQILKLTALAIAALGFLFMPAIASAGDSVFNPPLVGYTLPNASYANNAGYATSAGYATNSGYANTAGSLSSSTALVTGVSTYSTYCGYPSYAWTGGKTYLHITYSNGTSSNTLLSDTCSYVG